MINRTLSSEIQTKSHINKTSISPAKNQNHVRDFQCKNRNRDRRVILMENKQLKSVNNDSLLYQENLNSNLKSNGGDHHQSGEYRPISEPSKGEVEINLHGRAELREFNHGGKEFSGILEENIYDNVSSSISNLNKKSEDFRLQVKESIKNTSSKFIEAQGEKEKRKEEGKQQERKDEPNQKDTARDNGLQNINNKGSNLKISGGTITKKGRTRIRSKESLPTVNKTSKSSCVSNNSQAGQEKYFVHQTNLYTNVETATPNKNIMKIKNHTSNCKKQQPASQNKKIPSKIDSTNINFPSNSKTNSTSTSNNFINSNSISSIEIFDDNTLRDQEDTKNNINTATNINNNKQAAVSGVNTVNSSLGPIYGKMPTSIQKIMQNPKLTSALANKLAKDSKSLSQSISENSISNSNDIRKVNEYLSHDSLNDQFEVIR